ncbi:RcnB family protein [Croceicoccus mobilis]|uniref:Integral membrane protein n=1 Tax=Croceicoccus mobilis TaxID=1703339 RepID=A0A916YZU0_9SPHN|nr:RcnB family protein [Croceicoccus mobilis]GGD69669.1 hypothetical protein GCM10010990_19000 [Croceicoccus mobilis]
MKKLFASLAAAALILPGTAAMAAPQHNDRSDHAQSNHGQQVSKAAHSFKKGEKFDSKRATNYRVINYRDNRRLSAPPSGYRWVQNGNDALLVGITSGIVSAVVSNALN